MCFGPEGLGLKTAGVGTCAAGVVGEYVSVVCVGKCRSVCVYCINVTDGHSLSFGNNIVKELPVDFVGGISILH